MKGKRPSVTLSIYEIRLRDKRQTEKYYNLDDFCNGADFFKFIHSVVGNWSNLGRDNKTIIVNPDTQKAINLVDDTLKIAGRTLSAIVKTGDYGVSSEITDVNTGELKYEKTPDDADMMPFFVLFYIPENRKSAIMISQRYKQYGATSVIADSIRWEFSKQFPGQHMEIAALQSAILSDKFITGGNLKKITFKSFNPKVLNDVSVMSKLDPNDYILEYSIVSKRGKKIPNRLLNIFRRSVDSGKSVSDLIKIPYYDYNEIALELSMNGHRRTLKATDIDNLGSFFDITYDVDFDNKGFPTYDSILRVAKDVLDDIKQS